MTKQPVGTPLTVDDTNFLVTTAIDRCPSNMMARELIMNCIEAATRDVSGIGEIRIRAKELKQFPGTKKLAFWNNGPGMSATDLAKISNIAASLKPLGLRGNFGMGAKVASASVNQIGLRYRSCKDGIVSQTVIAKVDGVYMRLFLDVVGGYEDVQDVTATVKAEGEYSLDRDWTEVTLFGNTLEQNTVEDPFGDGSTSLEWLAESLYYRFYAIPSNVSIIFETGTNRKGDSNRRFQTIPERAGQFDRVETVSTADGFKVHYYYDPKRPGDAHNKSKSGAICSSISCVGIVYRGELYDVRKSNSWASVAPEFGVRFGFRHIWVHVELPDDFNVVPEQYRRFLQLSDGDQHQVYVTEFANIVRDNMPEWLTDVIKSYCPKPALDASEIEKELQSLLNDLAVRNDSLRADPTGNRNANRGSGSGEERESGKQVGPEKNPNPASAKIPARYSEAPGGAHKTANANLRDVAPKIEFLETEQEILDKQIVDKAACFEGMTNYLYINCTYPAALALQAHLEKQFAHHVKERGEEVHEIAMHIARHFIALRTGTSVVHAKAKALKTVWTQEDIDRACTPEAMSVACDSWKDIESSAYSEMRKKLGLTARQAKAA